jgi:ribonuclease HI
VVLQTDASLLGWGAVMNDSKTGGIWNYDEKENHINYLELLAVFYALKAFLSALVSA